MKLAEAEALWENVQRYVQHKMGTDYTKPTTRYSVLWIYELMAEDYVGGKAYADKEPTYWLRFWTRKYQEWRKLGLTELEGFLINRINEARRG